MQEIYFDNSATTMVDEKVIEYMMHVLKNTYGNPSALHKLGIDAENILKASRESIAKTLNVTPKEIIFTSGGTESNNFAIKGYLEENKRNGNHIITTKIEHPAVLEVFSYLKTLGFTVDYVNVLECGKIDLEHLKQLINKDTSLISVMYVNNETGAIQPIEQVIDIKNAVNPRIKLHVDAVQAYGKLPINLAALKVDMMSVSSHKIHGPKGVGCLFVRNGIRLHSQMLGGGQEQNLRSGTENVPSIAGFAKAATIMNENITQNMKHVSNLKKLFLEELEKTDIEYKVISKPDGLPYILNISFLNTKSEVMLHHLEQKGIYVSTGSACSQRRKKFSHVLLAMGQKSEVIDGAIRFSFSHFNTEQEVLKTVDSIKQIIPYIYIKKRGRI